MEQCIGRQFRSSYFDVRPQVPEEQSISSDEDDWIEELLQEHPALQRFLENDNERSGAPNADSCADWCAQNYEPRILIELLKRAPVTRLSVDFNDVRLNDELLRTLGELEDPQIKTLRLQLAKSGWDGGESDAGAEGKQNEYQALEYIRALPKLEHVVVSLQFYRDATPECMEDLFDALADLNNLRSLTLPNFSNRSFPTLCDKLSALLRIQKNLDSLSIMGVDHVNKEHLSTPAMVPLINVLQSNAQQLTRIELLEFPKSAAIKCAKIIALQNKNLEALSVGVYSFEQLRRPDADDIEQHFEVSEGYDMFRNIKELSIDGAIENAGQLDLLLQSLDDSRVERLYLNPVTGFLAQQDLGTIVSISDFIRRHESHLEIVLCRIPRAAEFLVPIAVGVHYNLHVQLSFRNSFFDSFHETNSDARKLLSFIEACTWRNIRMFPLLAVDQGAVFVNFARALNQVGLPKEIASFVFDLMRESRDFASFMKFLMLDRSSYESATAEQRDDLRAADQIRLPRKFRS